MNSTGYYRFATVAADAIVFVCEDDLWSVPRAGGVARRLTTSQGELSTPRLSPDGTQIAFVAREEGQPEVYVMPAAGGAARRLTFLGSDVCIVSGWTPDGASILFASDGASPFSKETQGFRVGREGGKPHALALGHVRTLSQNARGRLVLGRNNDDPARWKRYRGGTAGDLWVEHDEGRFERLISLKGNLVWPMWIGERIYFVSDHEGIANVYSVDAEGAGLHRHTHETEYFVRFPSTDGTTVAYTAGGRIYTLDVASDVVTAVDVVAPSTATQTMRRFVDVIDGLEDFAPSPGGTALTLVSRGRPFSMPLWEEAVVEHGAGSRVRYRAAEWLSDGERFVCVSDAGGTERLEIRNASGDGEAEIVTHDDIGRVTELATSPTADVAAVANHRNELLLVDLRAKTVRTIDKSPASRMHDLAFSPDGRWLAYCTAVSVGGVAANADTAIIRIAKVKSGAVHDVTPLMREDRAPAWDPDGNYLYFISTRDFNPVYDALQFDLSFPQASRPFVVTLRADVPSPFVPKPSPIHKDKPHDEDAHDKKRDDRPARIEIEFDGIQGRILGFPVDEGNYAQIVAAKGRALFTLFPVKGIKPKGNDWSSEDEVGTLLAYDFDQQRTATLEREIGDMRLSADGRTLVYTSRDRMRAIDALGELPESDDDQRMPNDQPGRRSGWLDLHRASVLVEPRDEWAQMLDEAWRMQTEQFWDPTMSGIDWNLVRERYKKLLPLVRTRAELSDVMWEMLGELGTSHAYEIGGDHRRPPNYRRGFLGADLVWDEQLEGYRIEKIYRGDSWNRDEDSPLAEPGVNLREGDAIVAIGGRPLTREISPDELLVNAAEREVQLTVCSRKRDRRRVVVRALRDERMLRYRAWVDDNRRFVHARTGGHVGYVHIPDMGPWGFSEFHRGFLSEFNRDALIVDVRYNRGGHVSPLLLEKLARKRVGYDVSRWGPPVPYPPESVAGPMVALTNQFAGSDGDIFSHCFKLYKLGPLVGKRTWGGVVGINPYHRLVDGTITTQPEFSFWFVDVGWRVENYGTDPDFDVDVAPHDSRAGADPQMEKALDLVAQLTAGTNGKPQFDGRPYLGIPTELVTTT
ncbi:MAG: PDZ domain-containing protein [Candidatus Eremiobacteraeota bacterium]|nr:PDZ domain-containing protein [Candidatus Eremiobacteraeota bacterium]